MQRARTIQRDANDAALFRKRLEDRLADPPYRVGNELDPLRFIELVRSANEAEVALVDQVRERHALVLIFLRDADDEPQVRTDQLVERFLITDADLLRERDLI